MREALIAFIEAVQSAPRVAAPDGSPCPVCVGDDVHGYVRVELGVGGYVTWWPAGDYGPGNEHELVSREEAADRFLAAYGVCEGEV